MLAEGAGTGCCVSGRGMDCSLGSIRWDMSLPLVGVTWGGEGWPARAVGDSEMSGSSSANTSVCSGYTARRRPLRGGGCCEFGSLARTLAAAFFAAVLLDESDFFLLTVFAMMEKPLKEERHSVSMRNIFSRAKGESSGDAAS